MEEIEICARCGKMVPLREIGESFTCLRCGNRMTMVVPLKDYEKVVQRLQEGKDPYEEEPAGNPGKKAKKAKPSRTKKKKR